MSRVNSSNRMIRVYRLISLMTTVSLVAALPVATQTLKNPDQSQTQAQAQVQQQAGQPQVQQQPRQPQEGLSLKDAINSVVSNNNPVKPSAPATESPKGLVTVDTSRSRAKVDVHVPLVFDMTNDNEGDRSRLDLSVLNGFVKVTKDKARGPNGEVSGPVTVTVFGIPVYTGSRALSELRQSKSGNQAEDRTRRTRLLDSQKDETAKVQSDEELSPFYEAIKAYQKTNLSVLRSIGEVLNKTAAFVIDRASPTSENVNGSPSDNKSRKFVVPSKFTAADMAPKVMAETPVEGPRKNLPLETNQV